LRLVAERAERGEGSGKAVIFTESVVTQDYICEQLVESGLYVLSEITVFRGVNDSARAREALDRWRRDTQEGVPRSMQPSPDIAVRSALVHEFRERSKIFISTEAGAKGLNLQFCETLVNFDLPWNPQRIEQRIGRCHRYGQKRSVTVINFVSSDNEAEKLTYEILSQKLNLFGTVLDASDHVLHRPGKEPSEAMVSALGPEFEAELRRIHERARTQEEIIEEIKRLRDQMDEKKKTFEDQQYRTASLIESHFDDEVREVFKDREIQVRSALEQLDNDIDRVACAFLHAKGIPFERVEVAPAQIDLVIAASDALPADLREGLTLTIGRSAEHTSLHLGHPLLRAALIDARTVTESCRAVRVTLDASLPEGVLALRGRTARLALMWVRYQGLEDVDEFIPIIVLEGSQEALPVDDARRILLSSMSDAEMSVSGRVIDDAAFDDVIDEVLFRSGGEVDRRDASAYRRKAEQIERFMDDRALLLRRQIEDIQTRLARAVEERDGAAGAERRGQAEVRIERIGEELDGIQATLTKIEERDDPEYTRIRSKNTRRRYAPPTPSRLFDVELHLT